MAILRHGLLVPVRVVAYQDANLVRPWIPFDAATFAGVRWFSDVNLPSVVPTQPTQDLPPMTGVLKGFKVAIGCLLGVFAVFCLVFGLVVTGFGWFGANPDHDTTGQPLMDRVMVVGFFAAFLGITYFMWRCLQRDFAPLERKAPPEKSRVQPAANFRFVFALPEGTQVEAAARVDRRSRLLERRTGDADLALYLLGDPKHAFLLDGVWPAIRIRDGNFVKQTSPAVVES